MWNSYSYIHQLQNNVFSESLFSKGGKLLHLDMVWTELNIHIASARTKCYIALEWACCFFSCYCQNFCNRESIKLSLSFKLYLYEGRIERHETFLHWCPPIRLLRDLTCKHVYLKESLEDLCLVVQLILCDICK